MGKATLFEAEFHSRTVTMKVFFVEVTFSILIHFRFLTRTPNRGTIIYFHNGKMCYCCEFTSVSVFVAQLTNKNSHRNVGHVELKTCFVIGLLNMSGKECCVTTFVSHNFMSCVTEFSFVEWSRIDCGERRKKSMNGRYLLQRDWKRLGCSHLLTILQLWRYVFRLVQRVSFGVDVRC